VFPSYFQNDAVYDTVGASIVKSSVLDGLNGTIFAYGVTSSGKTHTMMGDENTPGIVPHAVSDLFHHISESDKAKIFNVSVSMIEIYNEVVNDLLDPTNTNLRLREENTKSNRQVYVENLREEQIGNVHEALDVIALGNEHRKIGATAFNEGSSRSHTVIKITIEASDRPEFLKDKTAAARTVSSLTMVDLAGSESAKAEVNKNQRVEGSFINKSLLTLGTVIHKLSDGGAQHIPFRDSKLTRILSNSLSGNGARIAVVCTITPASTQAEETHNTLKFASRAKTITIEAKRNEILDQAALVAKYQQEIGLLRRQLELALKDGGASGVGGDAESKPNETSSIEIMSLREKIEEEHAAVVEGEQERLRLVERVEELSQALMEVNDCVGVMQERMRADGTIGEDESSKEAEKLRDILILLNNEIRRLKGGSGGFTQDMDFEEKEDYEVTMSAFYAEREFLNEKLEQQDAWNAVLANTLDAMKVLVAQGRGIDPDKIDMEAVLSGDYSSIGGDLSSLAKRDGEQDHATKLRLADPNIVEKVMKLESKVLAAISALQRKGEKLAQQSAVQKTLAGHNEDIAGHMNDLTVENQALKRELERVEAQNEQLQGYMVDHLSEQELLALIGNLTSAVERVRVTVSAKKISMKTQGKRSNSKLSLDFAGTGDARIMRMSCEDMNRALAALRDGLDRCGQGFNSSADSECK
jgi:centromeric protein E